MNTAQAMQQIDTYGAPNYSPLPVVIRRGDGAWVEDLEGKRYLDMLAAYSAVNFGHGHPEIVAAAQEQLSRVTLTSRAFHNDQLGPFCEGLAKLCGMEMVLPMNSGAEAVETAIKTARKWGYKVKGVPDGQAKIIVCDGNFHGRTTTIVSFSTDPQARADFGPYTPGFDIIPYGDAKALEAAIDNNTVAFLVEPIQGEGGVVVPPEGYLKAVRDICTRHRVLFIADEIQSGLGRTGYTFACDHEGVRPDLYILGKALGGGIMPISAVVSHKDILGVFKPGDHGSTFGGNPLACAIARRVIEILNRGTYQERARTLGEQFITRLRADKLPKIKNVRGRGLWIGVEVQGTEPAKPAEPAKIVCKQLMKEGLLCKETHETTLRLAPPLCIEQADLDLARGILAKVLG